MEGNLGVERDVLAVKHNLGFHFSPILVSEESTFLSATFSIIKQVLIINSKLTYMDLPSRNQGPTSHRKKILKEQEE